MRQTPPPAGSLSIFDLGYFSLERFRRIGEAKAYWISRFQHGTKVFDAAGKRLHLLRFLQQHGPNGLVDASVVLGEKERLPCRLIAVRVPAEVAARRRQKIREKARDHGREPSQEYLDLQEWTIFVTNCPPELLTWKEVVVLYRARWQIELLFKLWKSHNHLAEREAELFAATADGGSVRQIDRCDRATLDSSDHHLEQRPAQPAQGRRHPARLDRSADRGLG